MRLLFDPGATLVTLRNRTARSIGLDFSHAQYSEPVNTGRGVDCRWRLRLIEIDVEGIPLRDVVTDVKSHDAGEDLFGMSGISKLRGAGFENGYLVLRP